MKTKLACLVVIIAALLLGRWQASRITALESKIEHPEISRVTKVSTSRERRDETDYLTKHRSREAGVTAAQVFERLLPILKPSSSGNIMGVDAALQHPEAMKEILRLDLNGIRELMNLVSQSKELAKTRPMPQVTSILCLVAMADVNPQAAFAHVMKDKTWNQLFGNDQPYESGMVIYLLKRMSLDDPQQALDSLRVVQESGKLLNGDGVRSVILQVARTDPWLTLDYLTQQPETLRNVIVQAIGTTVESDEERTAMFRALRDRHEASPELTEKIFTSLCEPYNNRPKSWKWLEKLGMSDVEKIRFHIGITQAMSRRSDSPLEDARWIADFMPASPERNMMVWDILKTGEPADEVSFMAFLGELGIDPQEMIRRQREEN